MFEKTTSSSQVLTISNFLKGGDFMGIEQDYSAREAAIADAVGKMEWEGGIHIPEPESDPMVAEPIQTINPGQVRVPDSFNDPRFPKVGNHR